MSKDIQKACEQLAAICRQLLDDNYLSNNEILFLRRWLKEHADLVGEWPGDIVYKRIEQVLADGYIEPDEREHLTETLELVVSGQLSRPPRTEAMPVEDAGPIDIRDRVFCFSGRFVYGSKVACQRATMTAGAFAIKRPSNQLDYLVVGDRTGDNWRQTEVGNHVDLVRGFRAAGSNIGIISEEQWSRAIPVASLLWSG